MLTKAELERLPREIQKALEAVRSEKPGLPDEALLGEALSRDPQLIKVLREWEREGKPSPAEREYRKAAETLGKLRGEAEALGGKIAGLRKRADRLYPPPPPRDPQRVPRRPKEGGRESWTVPVRKAADEDWRARTLEGVIADLYALADAVSPELSRRLIGVINELNTIAEEIGGEKSRRRLKAMCAA